MGVVMHTIFFVWYNDDPIDLWILPLTRFHYVTTAAATKILLIPSKLD
jgi:hypothetical protein